MKTKMSLHRVIAEIKAIEGKLSLLPRSEFIFMTTGVQAAEKEGAADRAKSQAAYDQAASLIANHAILKAARNAANSRVTVSVGGKTMTIDEALAQKAALPYKQTLIATLQNQFVAAQRQVDANQAGMNAKVDSQVATMFSTGTKKATEDEVNLVRRTVENGAKIEAHFAEGLKDRLETLKEEVSAFTTEIDYVLSEANATNTVEVQLV